MDRNRSLRARQQADREYGVHVPAPVLGAAGERAGPRTSRGTEDRIRNQPNRIQSGNKVHRTVELADVHVLVLVRDDAAGCRALPDVHLYREVVSSDCNNKATAAFFAETELDSTSCGAPDPRHQPGCRAHELPAEQRATAPGRPDSRRRGLAAGRQVRARAKPARITTTKRIKFSHEFTSRSWRSSCACSAMPMWLRICSAARPPAPSPAATSRVSHAPQQIAPPEHACAAIPRNVGAAVGDCIEECRGPRRLVEKGRPRPLHDRRVCAGYGEHWARVPARGQRPWSSAPRGPRCATRERTEA